MEPLWSNVLTWLRSCALYLRVTPKPTPLKRNRRAIPSRIYLTKTAADHHALFATQKREGPRNGLRLFKLTAGTCELRLETESCSYAPITATNSLTASALF